jgi:hypothetical protein
MSKTLSFSMMTVAIVLLASQFAQATSLSQANAEARNLALQELTQSQRAADETPALKAKLGKLARAHIQPGPFCIQLEKSCYTQRQLGYRSSEYYSFGEFKEIPKAGIYTSIYETRFGNSSSDHANFLAVATQNNVSESALMLALEPKERLSTAFLRSYTKSHPNKPTHQSDNILYSYEWEINLDGEIIETEHRIGNGD